MSNGIDIDTFVKDPTLLVKLCREVIDELGEDAGNEHIEKIEEKESQLREISRAIERLEKAGVAVPDSLREAKTKLVATLAVQSEAYQSLAYFADELEKIIKELNSRLDRGMPSQPLRRSPGVRSTSPKTGRGWWGPWRGSRGPRWFGRRGWRCRRRPRLPSSSCGTAFGRS